MSIYRRIFNKTQSNKLHTKMLKKNEANIYKNFLESIKGTKATPVVEIKLERLLFTINSLVTFLTFILSKNALKMYFN